MTGFTYTIPELDIIDGQVNKFNVVFTDGNETYEQEFQAYANIELPMVMNVQIKGTVDLLNILKRQYGKIYDEYGNLFVEKIDEEL